MVAYKQYITTRLIERPSHINAPLRRQKLLTMSSTRAKKKRMTPKEQEAKQVIKCLRRRLQWCNENCVPFDSGEEQYSMLPRALADENGYPHKSKKAIGQKSYTIVTSQHSQALLLVRYHGYLKWSSLMQCL